MYNKLVGIGMIWRLWLVNTCVMRAAIKSFVADFTCEWPLGGVCVGLSSTTVHLPQYLHL